MVSFRILFVADVHLTKLKDESKNYFTEFHCVVYYRQAWKTRGWQGPENRWAVRLPWVTSSLNEQVSSLGTGNLLVLLQNWCNNTQYRMNFLCHYHSRTKSLKRIFEQGKNSFRKEGGERSRKLKNSMLLTLFFEFGLPNTHPPTSHFRENSA